MNTVGIGVTVILTWGNKVLLAKRKGSHGEGTWDTPGGHLERGETVAACARREVFEETSIRLVEDIKEIGFTEDFFANKHYISCVVTADIDGSVVFPKMNEPHKFSTEWMWYEVSCLPSPLFIPVKNAFEKYHF